MGVDVLAVMDDDRLAIGIAIDVAKTEFGVESWDLHLSKHDDARSAVRELIEAVSEVYGEEVSALCANRSPDCVSCRIQRAVARVTGATDGR